MVELKARYLSQASAGIKMIAETAETTVTAGESFKHDDSLLADDRSHPSITSDTSQIRPKQKGCFPRCCSKTHFRTWRWRDARLRDNTGKNA